LLRKHLKHLKHIQQPKPRPIFALLTKKSFKNVGVFFYFSKIWYRHLGRFLTGDNSKIIVSLR